MLAFAAFRQDQHSIPQSIKVRLSVGRDDWLHPSTTMATREIDARQHPSCTFSLHRGSHHQMWWPKVPAGNVEFAGRLRCHAVALRSRVFGPSHWSALRISAHHSY